MPITHQAERLRRMVGQLLVASRLESGVLTPRVEVFAAAPLVERVLGGPPSRSAVRTRRARGRRTLAVADPDRVEQVLWALLDNAVKYSAGRIGNHGDPRVGRRQRGDRRQGQGRRDGRGNAATRIRTVLPGRQRAGSSRPTEAASASTLRIGLMRAMGGDLRLASRLGGGTTMTLSLPGRSAKPGPTRSGPAPNGYVASAGETDEVRPGVAGRVRRHARWATVPGWHAGQCIELDEVAVDRVGVLVEVGQREGGQGDDLVREVVPAWLFVWPQIGISTVVPSHWVQAVAHRRCRSSYPCCHRSTRRTSSPGCRGSRCCWRAQARSATRHPSRAIRSCLVPLHRPSARTRRQLRSPSRTPRSAGERLTAPHSRGWTSSR